MSKGVIAIDADGVLLDYSLAYAHAWQRAFGTFPVERDPDAYWPIDRWGLEWLAGERLAMLKSCFDEQFWEGIPAVEGALEGCRLLVAEGYELVCVSAVDANNAEARRRNLLKLGFPISELVATGNAAGDVSPKAAALLRMKPAAFVDDYLPYHRGVDASIHKALVLRASNGSPNVGDELQLVHSQHRNLLEFAKAWPTLSQSR